MCMEMLRAFGVNSGKWMTHKQVERSGFGWRCVDMTMDDATQWQHACHEYHRYPLYQIVAPTNYIHLSPCIRLQALLYSISRIFAEGLCRR